MGSSPQRIAWVTEPEEIEARPGAFSIQRAGNQFIIQDPEGQVIRKRANIIAEIRKGFPDVPLARLDDASFSYYDYSAIVEI